MIATAATLAVRAHIGQSRKVSGMPYIVHPYRVANLVEMMGGTDEMIAAAWCHDVLEDCPAFRDEAARLLPTPVFALVKELTKREVSPGVRVKGEVFMEELRTMSIRAKTIKMCDRIDNLCDGMKDMPREWLEKYLQESRELMNVCERTTGNEIVDDMDCNNEAWRHLMQTIIRAENKLALG